MNEPTIEDVEKIYAKGCITQLERVVKILNIQKVISDEVTDQIFQAYWNDLKALTPEDLKRWQELQSDQLN